MTPPIEGFPLISFRHPIKMVDVHKTHDNAYDHLEQLMEKELKNKNMSKITITVAYKGLFKDAVNLSKYLNDKYEEAELALIPAGDFAAQHFGPHIGVCIF